MTDELCGVQIAFQRTASQKKMLLKDNYVQPYQEQMHAWQLDVSC